VFEPSAHKVSLEVRRISSEQHSDYLDGVIASGSASVSFLQLPSWGSVKVGWRPESVGWFLDSTLVGVAFVLYRPIPKLPARSLAYIPEGPVIDWDSDELSSWLSPLVSHVKGRGAFQLKMGPPIAIKQWDAPTIKAAIGEVSLLGEVVADREFAVGDRVVASMRSLGFVQEVNTGAGFGDVQPRYVFQVPLAGRTEADVFAGFNQLWRRNVRKAEKSDVEISIGTRAELGAFHEVYVETAARDGFTPRGLVYFERMWDALGDHFSLHVARVSGHVAAATIMITVGRHAWYSYGASTTADREVRPSNALQWSMIKSAIESGCSVYDLRGISNTLDSSDHLFGLVSFKLGSGGFAQEYVGEWDYVIRKLWARAFSIYQRRG
jgi:lipid II:glycine glycyltransferase (peptidoglycan interpeptide bridge formation enzyme)